MYALPADIEILLIRGSHARNRPLSVLPNSFEHRLTSRRLEAGAYRLTHSRNIDVAGCLLCKHFG